MLVVLVKAVVGFRLIGARLAEDLTAQSLCEERFDVGRVGSHHQVQQIRCGAVVGDQVRGVFADAEVQDLDVPGALPCGHFAGALGNLFGVSGTGNKDAHGAVEDLVHAVEHLILVMRGQHIGRDLVAAAKY
ncbi:hypothetical protein PJL18_04416 [Paenarthrobacter nicotinovorans]|nr:hypothetical protein [Paenarthrobacter nicotinovorans]